MLGRDIAIPVELCAVGGSLDGSGTPQDGYVPRGGRILESKYLGTFGLFASMATLAESMSMIREIEQWNRTTPTSSKSRLVRRGNRQTEPSIGLSEWHILAIKRMALELEDLPDRTNIAKQFDPAFFATDFWYTWCTTFAFQSWCNAVEFGHHLARFAHMASGFIRLESIQRTPLNQYDSLMRPSHKWLLDRGVRFEMGTCVTGLEFGDQDGVVTVTGISFAGRNRRDGPGRVGGPRPRNPWLKGGGVQPGRHRYRAGCGRQDRRRGLDAVRADRGRLAGWATLWKMVHACNGQKIMTDVLGRLHIRAEAVEVLDACTCIPYLMPFITSQFMSRGIGDRPPMLPSGTRNLAFTGQFGRLPQDVAFTVEYSVCSAQVTVQGLPGLQREASPVYQGKFDPHVLRKTFWALHDVRA